MKIDIISDTVCPWCFIGKRRLERALRERPEIDADVRWHPFQLNPEMPLDGIDRQTYLNLKFGGSINAEAVYSNISSVGANEDLDFNFAAISRTPNSLLSHRLIYFCRNNSYQSIISENLFRSYFFHGLDIGKLSNLVNISEDSGLNAGEIEAYLRSGNDSQLIRIQDKHSRKLGISGVPCFIINDEFVVSGAQEAEVFLQVFDAANEKSSGKSATSSAVPQETY